LLHLGILATSCRSKFFILFDRRTNDKIRKAPINKRGSLTDKKLKLREKEKFEESDVTKDQEKYYKHK
jgi:hypothetical protein